MKSIFIVHMSVYRKGENSLETAVFGSREKALEYKEAAISQYMTERIANGHDFEDWDVTDDPDYYFTMEPMTTDHWIEVSLSEYVEGLDDRYTLGKPTAGKTSFNTSVDG